MAIIRGTEGFAKIMGTICNIPIEAANICNILLDLQIQTD